MNKKHKRSLGGLRPNKAKTFDQQPDYIGRILLKRETIQRLYEDLQNNHNPIIEADMSGWSNQKRYKNGKVDSYVSVEIRPLQDRQTPIYFPEDDENPIHNIDKFFI